MWFQGCQHRLPRDGVDDEYARGGAIRHDLANEIAAAIDLSRKTGAVGLYCRRRDRCISVDGRDIHPTKVRGYLSDRRGDWVAPKSGGLDDGGCWESDICWQRAKNAWSGDAGQRALEQDISQRPGTGDRQREWLDCMAIIHQAELLLRLNRTAVAAQVDALDDRVPWIPALIEGFGHRDEGDDRTPCGIALRNDIARAATIGGGHVLDYQCDAITVELVAPLIECQKETDLLRDNVGEWDFVRFHGRPIAGSSLDDGRTWSQEAHDLAAVRCRARFELSIVVGQRADSQSLDRSDRDRLHRHEVTNSDRCQIILG